MRALLASAALLIMVAVPAAAQESGRGYLTSIATGTFLCASEGGFALQVCAPSASRLRFYAIERTDGHVDFEIQLAVSGACLASEGTPIAGARLTTAPCERQLWRYDLERFRLTYAGLCLAAGENGHAVTLAPCEADRGAASRRLEWAIAVEG